MPEAAHDFEHGSICVTENCSAPGHVLRGRDLQLVYIRSDMAKLTTDQELVFLFLTTAESVLHVSLFLSLGGANGSRRGLWHSCHLLAQDGIRLFHGLECENGSKMVLTWESPCNVMLLTSAIADLRGRVGSSLSRI